MVREPLIPLLLGACLAGCDQEAEPALARAEAVLGSGSPAAPPAASAEPCSVTEAAVPLPEEVRETSGLARSRRDPALFWTHNDRGNGPDLFAVDASGALRGRVRLAVESVDWEDVEVGPCAEGTCLYVADIGDNDADRETVTVYRLPEPAADAADPLPAVALRARYPDGPRDAESLFVLPSGAIYLVTKGREGPVALYRFPDAAGPGEVATLERVREILPEPSDERHRVTAATASPDGRRVAIRSYATLYLYPAAALVGGGAVEATEVDLAPLDEAQGEGLAMGDDGSVWLTSEAESRRDAPRLGRMRCSLPGAED